MPHIIKPLAESYWVIPDRLLAGRYPGGKNAQEVERRLGPLLDAGFDTFLDLTEPDELPSYEPYLPEEVEHLRRPIKDHGVPRDPAHMRDILAALDDALRRGRLVYVHCRAGIGRTGTVVACHLVDQGLSGTDALLELNDLWQGSDRSDTWPEVPETEEQVEFIHEWATYRRRHPARTSAQREVPGAAAAAGAPPGPAVTPGPAPIPVPAAAPERATSPERATTPERAATAEASATPKAAAAGEPLATSQPMAARERVGASDADAAPDSAAAPASVTPDPMVEPEVMDAARSLRERFHGALLGLAVGDALAAHTQFRKPGTFPPVGDLLGGGPFDLPRGAWTDDTAMALLLAESLIQREGFDAQDQVQRLARWKREGYGSATGQCVGISANVARAIATAEYKRQPFAGSHDPDQLDKEPLSRVAPVVMFFFADVAAATARAAEAARLTAQAPMVLDCTRLLAAMLYQALSGREKAAVLRPPRELWTTQSTRPELVAVYEGSYARRSPPDISGGGHIVHALEAALWAFHRTANFREGALAAANLGRDSDVVTAVYGQLAGAHYGVSGIPGIWRNSLMKHDLVIETADRLLTHALVTLGG